MALRAGRRRVRSLPEFGGARVLERGHLERLGRVARRARRSELAEVRVLVAGGARRTEPLQPDRRPARRRELRRFLLVALLARQGRVLAGERERRLRVVELHRRELRPRDGVAGFAGGRDLAEVRFLVAGRARRRQAPVRPLADRHRLSVRARLRPAVTLLAREVLVEPREELGEPRVLRSPSAGSSRSRGTSRTRCRGSPCEGPCGRRRTRSSAP